MNRGLEFVHKSMLAYSAACRPLCQELKLTQTAFDILMFLANNPCCKTASEIVEIRHIKPNLVSAAGEGRPQKNRTDLHGTRTACDRAGESGAG